jgi:hypothetical protein
MLNVNGGRIPLLRGVRGVFLFKMQMFHFFNATLKYSQSLKTTTNFEFIRLTVGI